MKILFLSITIPYPPTDGGRIRVLNLLKHLAKKNEITLLALETEPTDNEGIDYLRRQGIEAHLVPQGQQLPPLTLQTGIRALIKRQPITVARYDIPAFRDTLHSLLAENAFDLIHYEMFHTAQYLVKGEIPGLLALQNIDSYIWRRLCEQTANPLRKLLFWTQQRAFARYERVMSPKFNVVACASEIDRDVLRAACPNLRAEVIPNGVDIESYQPNPALEEPATLIFTGSMDWYPNEDAVTYFADEILPGIRAKRPEVEFYIVGKNPTDRVQGLESRPGVVVTGRVEDIQPYISRATVYVVPLRIGSGTRLKILEALAMGKAVVSTTVGAEGLNLSDGEEIFLADEPTKFGDVVLRLIGDEPMRRQLGENGRQRVEVEYDWRRIGEKLHLLYEATAFNNFVNR
jgi:polysaccharide biosynthesis protein PslH